MKSALDFDLTPAKFCVSLRKLLNHSVHQIGEIMIALNLRDVAGMKEMIPVKSLVCVPWIDGPRIVAEYSLWKEFSILIREFGRHYFAESCQVGYWGSFP